MIPEAERTVSPDLANTLVHTQFPFVTGDLVLLGQGWDNTVYAAEPWTFRFPRREVALPLLEREVRVLPALAAALPLPVPVPVLHGAPSEAFPWPFTGAALIAGDEVGDAPFVDRKGLAADVGAFLRVLHSQEPPDGLPVDPTGRGWPSHREPRTREALVALSALQLVEIEAEPLLMRAGALGPSSSQVLVHGDLHLRHVLVGPTGRAAGVIDWGDCCLGDPSIDLSFGFAAFEGATLDAFISAYGEVSAEQELRARALALGLCAILAVHGHERGYDGLLRESLAAIPRVLAVD